MVFRCSIYNAGGHISAANAFLHVNPSVTTTYYLRAEGANSPCTPITPSGQVTVTVRQRPTATWGGNQTLCNGSATLSITLTGVAPWTFTYSTNNCVTTTSVTTSTNPYTFIVSPGATVTYKICSLSDAQCVSVPADYKQYHSNGNSSWRCGGNVDRSIRQRLVQLPELGEWVCANDSTAVTIPNGTPQCQINAAGAVCASLTVSGSSLLFHKRKRISYRCG
jgi:hypothetical protein